MSELINGSICLTDIDGAKIVAHANGKKYLNITIAQMREPDQYGNTHTIYITQKQNERTAGEGKIYIGKAKAFVFGATPSEPAVAQEVEDDLPF